MPTRHLARKLGLLQGFLPCQNQASRLAATASTCRSLATTSDPSLGPSTSVPTLPPSLHELQTTLRAPQSFAVNALDAQLHRGDADVAASRATAAELDDALCRGTVQSNCQLTPGQLDALRLLRRYNGGMPLLKGQTILVKVLSVDSKRVLVDTGSHGLSELQRDDVTIAHIYSEDDAAPEDRLSTSDVRPGDLLKVRVEALYTPYGDMQLSAPRDDIDLRRRLVWNELRRLMTEKQPVSGRVLNDCQGGFAVGVAGFVAFLPVALAATATTRRVGVRQQFLIASMDDARQRIVLRDPAMRRTPLRR